MTNPRHTSVLALVLVALLVADGLAWRAARAARAPLPVLESFEVELPTALELVQGDIRVRFERTDGRWWEVSPTRHPADPEGIAGVLEALAQGIRPDARSGEDLAEYGLEGADPIRVEAFADGASLSAVYVGHDAPGGGTFVRFSGADEAYLARVGGRARFERSPGAWLDRQLWRVDAPVAGFSVEGPDGARVGLVRATDGRWALEDEPGFPVDPVLATAMATGLARLGARAIHPADRFPSTPSHVLHVRFDDGTERRAELAVDGDTLFAAVDGVEATYELPAQATQLLAPRESWRDKTLWTLRGVREVEWVDAQGSRAPRQSTPALGAFAASPRVSAFVVVDPAAAGLPGARSIVVVGERTETLQLGGLAPGALEGRDGVYVRAASRPDRIGLLDAELVRRLEAAFR